MKCIALLLIIVTVIAAHSQGQTVQKKSNYLKSHVIKRQNNLAAKKVKTDNPLADSLTIEEKLTMIPLGNNLYDKVNVPFKTSINKYLKGFTIKHKLLFKSMNTAVKTWYTDKYDINYFQYEWVHGWLQQSLSRPLPVNMNNTSFRSINQGWIQF